jgi:hypothetical protein
MRMARGRAEGRLDRGRVLRSKSHNKAQVGQQIVQNPIRLEENICAAAQPCPKIIDQARKIAFRRRILLRRCRQQGAMRSRGQVARCIGPVSWCRFFPDGFGQAVEVAGDLDRRPGELRQGSDQAADQCGLAHVPPAPAHDDDRHFR